MKKTNFQRIISLILALVMLVGMVSINVFAADSETEATAVPTVMKNVYFGEKINLMFALPAADVADAEVEFTVADGANTFAVSEFGTETVLGVDYVTYIVNTGVAAQNIDKVFTVAVAIDGQEIANFTYSVLEYLYERLLTDEIEDDQKAMYENLIAYADSADKVINKDAAGIADKYVYVTTVNCTFDGGKTAGIVEKNTVAAFASTEEVADGAILTYTIKSLDGAGSAIKSAEEMATYALENHCVVTAKIEEVVPDVVQLTASVNVVDYAALNGWANDTKHTVLNVNSNVKVTVAGGDNTGKYYTSGNNWRVYQIETPSITVSITNGQILTVKITYVSEKNGILTLNGENIESETFVDVNDTSVVFGVGNTDPEGTDGTKGQVRITAVEVKYQVASHTCDFTDATCTALASCTICGATTGELAAHDWVDATCTAPKTCSVCKAAEGVALPHADVNPIDHICDNCSAENVSSHVDADGDEKCDNGCSVIIPSGTSAQEYTETLSIFANKGTLSGKVITWTQGDVTVSNAQANSTNAIRVSDSDHFRVYAKSELTITAAGGAIKQIVITCTSSDYATVLKNSLTTTGATAVANGTVVTVLVNSGTVESVLFTMTAQSRIKKVEITYEK